MPPIDLGDGQLTARLQLLWVLSVNTRVTGSVTLVFEALVIMR